MFVLFTYLWPFGLFPPPRYYDLCCYEHACKNNSSCSCLYLGFMSRNGVGSACFEHPFQLWRVLFWSLASSRTGSIPLSQTPRELGPKCCYQALLLEAWIEREQFMTGDGALWVEGTCCQACCPVQVLGTRVVEVKNAPKLSSDLLLHAGMHICACAHAFLSWWLRMFFKRKEKCGRTWIV